MFEFFWRRNASVWLAVLYIVLGLPLVIYPDLSGRIFCWCLAGGSVVYASSHLWRYVEGRQEGYPAVSDLALAIRLMWTTAATGTLAFTLLLLFTPHFWTS